MEKIIYQIRNIVNDKLYVGSSVNYKNRVIRHLNDLRSDSSCSTKLQQAWNKYGEKKFVFEILEYVSDHMDLFFVEEEYIILNDSINNGYNIKLPYSEQNSTEFRHIKGVNKLKDYYKENAPLGLKRLTEEEWLKRRNDDPNFTIRNMSKGKPRGGSSERSGKEIVGINNEGVIAYEFRTIFQAHKHYKAINKCGDGIGKCCKNNSLYKDIFKCQEIYWYYKNSFVLDKFLELKRAKDLRRKNKAKKHPDDIIPYTERNIVRIPISIKHIITNEVLNFKSIKECADFLKVRPTRIHELKKGYKNNGRGMVRKITSIKQFTLL